MMCPQEESNFYRKIRNLTFYPLNYGDWLFKRASYQNTIGPVKPGGAGR